MAKAGVDFDSSTITNSPEKKKQLDGYIQEALLAKRSIRQQNDAIKDIRNEAKTELRNSA